MAKVFSQFDKDVITAYSFKTGLDCWQIYSDSETLSRIFALLHESEIEATPVFSMVPFEVDLLICDITILEVNCSTEDLKQASYWLLERSHYKVEVKFVEGSPAETTQILKLFRQ